MISGPAQVIFPSTTRFWISAFELGNVVSDALMTILLSFWVPGYRPCLIEGISSYLESPPWARGDVEKPGE
jgi:hypothetical protein